MADSGSLDDSASTIDLNKRPSNDSGPKPKLEILDNFKIESELGHGGMGEVYLATERGLNRQVALKVLPAANRMSSRQVQRFLLEAKAAAQLSHDHIVPIYHVGECGGVHYFTMRYIEGYDLAQIIRSGQRAMRELTEGSVDTQSPSDYKPKSKSGKSGESTAKDRADSTNGLIDFSTSSFVGSLRSSGSRSAHKLAVSVALIGQAVADALQHAHEHGIVHRDIKPSNLMLDNSNKVWVTDFGLAQLQDNEGMTKTGEMLGTLRYMSPEQASARPAFIDHRTDIYSLGVTLYELATLQKACRGESAQEILRSITFERPQPIRKINPKLPRDLETIIFKATERNPSDRYQSAAEMADDLRRFANSESLMARRPSRLKGVRNWIWDRPAVSAMALGMLIVFAGSMFAVAMVVNEQRQVEIKRANEALATVSLREGQQLINKALLNLDEHPSLAIAAAIEGATAAPGPLADRALMAAIDANHEVRTIRVKSDIPGRCLASHDGRQLLLFRRSLGNHSSFEPAIVFDMKAGTELGSLESVLCIADAAFSEDDRYILTMAPEKTLSKDAKTVATQLEVWDSTTRQSLKTFPHSSAIRTTTESFFPNKRQVVLPNSQRSATIYELPTFNHLLVLPTIHDRPVLECKFTKDGTKVVTWSEDKTAIIWDAANGNELRRVEYSCQDATSTNIFVTPDSRHFCISGDAGTRVFNLEDKDIEFFRPERIACVSGRIPLIYFYSMDGSSLLIMDTNSKQILKKCENGRPISGAVVLAEDEYLAAISDENIDVFETQSGAHVARFRGHEDMIACIAPLSGRGQLASYGWDGTVRHWDVLTDRQRRLLPVSVENGPAPVMGQSADGSRAIVGSVRETSSTLRSLPTPKDTTASIQGTAILALSDGRILTSSKGHAALWALKTQRRIQSVEITSKSPIAVWLAEELAESKSIALVTNDNQFLIWNLETNQLSQPSKLLGQVYAMTWDKAHNSLLLGLSTGELTSFNPKTFEVTEVTRFAKSIRKLDVHKSKNQILVTCVGSSIFSLDMASPETHNKISHAGIAITDAYFVGEDQILSRGGSSGAALWSWNSGELIEHLPLGQVFEIDFTSDRSAAAFASEKGLVYWDLKKNHRVSATDKECRTVAFIGERLAYSTESEDNASSELTVWDPGKEQADTSFSLDQWISQIYSQGLGDQFVISSFAFGAEVVDLEHNKSVGRFLEHRQPLVLADFTSQPEQLVTLSIDGVLKVHNLRSGATETLTRQPMVVTAATLSQDRHLLFVADQSGKLSQWDLVKRVSKEILPVGEKVVSKLVVDQSSNTLLAVVGDSLLRQWDLRAESENSFVVDKGVRDVALAPDGQSILVAMGRDAFHPAHPVFTADAIEKGWQYGLMLIEVNSGVQKQLPTQGIPISCQFADSGKCLAVLSSLGKLEVFNAADLKPQALLQSTRRYMKLMTAPKDTPWVIASAKDRVTAWSWQNGQLAFELTTALSEDETALLMPPKLLENQKSSSYLLFFGHDRFIQQPKNVLEYARKIAPRILTGEERSQLIEAR